MQNDVGIEPPETQEADSSSPVPLIPSFLLASESQVSVDDIVMGTGEAAWVSFRSPGRPGPNEDACAAIPLAKDSGLLLVADGLGGHRGGSQASRRLRSAVVNATKKLTRTASAKPSHIVISKVLEIPSQTPQPEPSELDYRSAMLEEIERVNRQLLRGRLGAATTLALVELKHDRIRTYHVGDSEILVVSQRGRIKYSTVSHSPVGYALESGFLTEEEALLHPDRHLVSNVVGSLQMSIELGPWISLSPRDTVLLGSDGLFDNMTQQDIIEIIRKGPLAQSVQELAVKVRDRMIFPHPDHPCKPDDLTIMAYRPTAMSR